MYVHFETLLIEYNKRQRKNKGAEVVISYWRRVSVTLDGRLKMNLLLVLWVKNGDKSALKA